MYTEVIRLIVYNKVYTLHAVYIHQQDSICCVTAGVLCNISFSAPAEIFAGTEQKYGSTLWHSHFYHTSNSHECMGVNGEVLQLHAVYKLKSYFLYSLSENLISFVTCNIKYGFFQLRLY